MFFVENLYKFLELCLCITLLWPSFNKVLRMLYMHVRSLLLTVIQFIVLPCNKLQNLNIIFIPSVSSVPFKAIDFDLDDGMADADLDPNRQLPCDENVPDNDNIPPEDEFEGTPALQIVTRDLLLLILPSLSCLSGISELLFL